MGRRDHSALTSVNTMLPRSFQVAELVPATSLAKASALVSSGRVGPATSQVTAGEILPHRGDHSALTSVKPVLPRSFQVAELVPATSLAKDLGNLADTEAIVPSRAWTPSASFPRLESLFWPNASEREKRPLDPHEIVTGC